MNTVIDLGLANDYIPVSNGNAINEFRHYLLNWSVSDLAHLAAIGLGMGLGRMDVFGLLSESNPSWTDAELWDAINLAD